MKKFRILLFLGFVFENYLFTVNKILFKFVLSHWFSIKGYMFNKSLKLLLNTILYCFYNFLLMTVTSTLCFIFLPPDIASGFYVITNYIYS